MYKSIIIVIMSLFLMYCVGGSLIDASDEKTIEIKTTTGQELNDLKVALDSGAITQEEYDDLRKKIMERLDAPIDSTGNN